MTPAIDHINTLKPANVHGSIAATTGVDFMDSLPILAKLQYDVHERMNNIESAGTQGRPLGALQNLDFVLSTLRQIASTAKVLLVFGEEARASSPSDNNAAFLLLITLSLRVIQMYEILIRMATKNAELK